MTLKKRAAEPCPPKREARRRTAPRRSLLPGVLAAGLVVVVIVLALNLRGARDTGPAAAPVSAPAAQAPVPAPAEAPPPSPPPALALSDLPPLPPGTPVRPRDVVAAVHEFAARRPDVLRYVPCFCGCEQAGHKGNDDCFVKRRDAQGRVVEWDPHGMT